MQEDGTHSQLMAKKGIYTKLVLAQNGGNEDDTKDVERLSEDEDDSGDEAVKGKSWMADDISLNNVPVGLARTASIRSRKSADNGV